jgi:hypothetical protein
MTGSRPGNYLVHINIGGLLDRKRNRAGDRIWRHRKLLLGSGSWALNSGLVISSAKFVRKMPGEMIVARTSLRTADPSRRARSLRSFVLARDDKGKTDSARLSLLLSTLDTSPHPRHLSPRGLDGRETDC